MVNIKSTNFIKQSQCVHTQVRYIAGELEHSPQTYRKFHLLTKKLDATLKIFNAIKEQSAHCVFGKITAEALEQEIVTLYGRIIDAWVDSKVNQIQDEASHIENALLNGGRVTAKTVQKLARHMQAFKSDHRPSLQQRRILAEAEHIMTRAHAFLKGEASIDVQKPSLDPSFTKEVEAAITAAEVEELMDIASCIYNCDVRQAKMKYLQLPEEQKQGFLRHIQLLGAQPFLDPFESIQAFIALTNELVANGEMYPSQAQIDELFAGLSQVNLQESEESDKVFSFRSKRSLG